MRVISGKASRQIGSSEFSDWVRSRDEITLDLGTGDGRFVRDLALRQPDTGVIGLDLCAENMRRASRARADNALFIAADALAMPQELHQVATRITINFPWGSLVRGLLAGDAGLLDGLAEAARKGARLDLLLNAGALAEAGWPLEAGSERIVSMLRDAGIATGRICALGPRELRACQTTWAKRLAFGRDPRAVQVTGVMGDG